MDAGSLVAHLPGPAMPTSADRCASPVRTTSTSDPVTFDYGSVPLSLRKAVREQAAAIQALLAKTAISVVQIGLRLQFVRDRLGRERFGPWVKAEFAWSQPTASNYMRAAKTFGELDCIGQFQPTALFILARKKATVAARHEAIRAARQGQRITKAKAQAIVERHTSTVGEGRRQIDRLRRLILKKSPQLSAGDVRRLAEELWALAATMK